MARAIAAAIRRSGISNVILFNEEGANMTIAERVRRINALRPLLVISVHHNSMYPKYLKTWSWQGKPRLYCEHYRGASVYFSQENDFAGQSRAIATDLRFQMAKAGMNLYQHPEFELRKKGIVAFPGQAGLYRYDSLGVLRGPNCPAVLLECGMIVNRDEELLLRDKAYQRKLATVVAQSVKNQLKLLAPVAREMGRE